MADNSLSNTNPAYDVLIEHWNKMRDLAQGEDAVKAKGITYLPETVSMRIDGMQPGQEGYHRYNAYRMRAVFPDYVIEAVKTLVGLLNQKDATIELPEQLEVMRDRATQNGESLQDLLRRIHIEQLTTGRIGLLLDIPTDPEMGEDIPYIATYYAEAIRNWDDHTDSNGSAVLNMVILDESGWIRDGFAWKMEKRYRVLILGEVDPNEATETYRTGLFTESNGEMIFNEERLIAPAIRGKALEEIPFVFINAVDTLSTPDRPPLLELGNMCLTIYRAEADYRQSLFMQGQDTLVIIGGLANPEGVAGETDAVRTGSSSRLVVDMGGDAKFIGVNSQGLVEQREALQNDRNEAKVRAGQLVNSMKTSTESGEALKTRFTAQTATLNQIAKTSAAALEQLLKTAAEWVGANPEKVKVTPNLEFADFNIDSRSIVELMTARTMGAPISKRSIHNYMQERGLTTLTFEEEMEEIMKEDGNIPGTGVEDDDIDTLEGGLNDN